MMKPKVLTLLCLLVSICMITSACLAGKTSQSSTKSTKSTTSSTTTSGTTGASTTAAATLAKGSAAFQKLLVDAVPIFTDTFEEDKHSPATIDSPFYKQSVASTRSISFTSAETGKGVHLDDFNSYIGYAAGTIPASEGTIRFAYKPDADLFPSYSKRQAAWTDYGTYAPPFMGFFIDTVGWNPAFTGGYTVGLFFSPDNNAYSNVSFGTWSGSGWSNTSAELTSTIKWDSSKWYDIVISYSQAKTKLAVYIDSYIAGEAPFNTALSQTEGFFIGQDPWKTGVEYWPYGPHALKGTYSNLRIYDQALMD